jgi:hypothetical protein
MKKIFALILIFKILFFTNCIDKIDVDNGEVVKKLIVDGFISDLPGAYAVRLYNSLSYTSSDVTLPVGGAQIDIVDDKGVSYRLKETFTGYYESDSTVLRGVPGRSYYLKIRSAEGKQYVSTPEKMPASIPIDNVTSAYANGQLKFNMTVESKDPPQKGNYYRWKWTHYRSIKLCLERFFNSNGTQTKEEADCCEPCWKFEIPRGELFVNADDIFNGKSFKQLIGQVPYTSTDPYFVVIEQQSLTKETYQFWDAVDTQIKNSGGIFDNPPALISGNIRNVTDSTEQVLGIFSAIGISRKPYNVDRNTVPNIKPITPNIPNAPIVKRPNCLSCNNFERTKVKPFGWP